MISGISPILLDEGENVVTSDDTSDDDAMPTSMRWRARGAAGGCSNRACGPSPSCRSPHLVSCRASADQRVAVENEKTKQGAGVSTTGWSKTGLQIGEIGMAKVLPVASLWTKIFCEYYYGHQEQSFARRASVSPSSILSEHTPKPDFLLSWS